MLRNITELSGYKLKAKDGIIGSSQDFLFDDRLWTIRYLAADTGKWLPGRKVLISPISLGKPDWQDDTLSVNLTKEQIEQSPPLDADAPVSRQFELKYHNFFEWQYYWGGVSTWGASAYPYMLYNNPNKKNSNDENDIPDDAYDNNLRSTNEVKNYHISATDEEIGHVKDFILDDETWTIRYIVIDTKNWLPGKKVLLSPKWIKAIDWSDQKVNVDLTREQVKECPEYDPKTPITREYEVKLYNFYGRPHDWE